MSLAYAAMIGIGAASLEHLFWWFWEKRASRKKEPQPNANISCSCVDVAQVKDYSDAK